MFFSTFFSFSSEPRPLSPPAEVEGVVEAEEEERSGSAADAAAAAAAALAFGSSPSAEERLRCLSLLFSAPKCDSINNENV